MISGNIKDGKCHSLNEWSACSGKMVTIHFLARIQLVVITHVIINEVKPTYHTLN